MQNDPLACMRMVVETELATGEYINPLPTRNLSETFREVCGIDGPAPDLELLAKAEPNTLEA